MVQARGQFGNPDKGERLPFEAVTRGLVNSLRTVVCVRVCLGGRGNSNLESAVTNCVVNCLTNPFVNQNPVYSNHMLLTVGMSRLEHNTTGKAQNAF